MLLLLLLIKKSCFFFLKKKKEKKMIFFTSLKVDIVVYKIDYLPLTKRNIETQNVICDMGAEQPKRYSF